jgi:hypothetical protein
MKIKSTVVLMAVVGLAGPMCWSKEAEPLKVEKVQTVSATVMSIDVAKRLVELKGPKGRVETVEVPAEVRNLAQVKVGDKVVVRYGETLGAVMKTKGTSTTLNSADQAVVAARAAPGAKPGAAVGQSITTTVVIDTVDTKANTVSFTGPEGYLRLIHVKDPKAQKFIATLKKDDHVELTYTEALAISIEPAK